VCTTTQAPLRREKMSCAAVRAEFHRPSLCGAAIGCEVETAPPRVDLAARSPALINEGGLRCQTISRHISLPLLPCATWAARFPSPTPLRPHLARLPATHCWARGSRDTNFLKIRPKIPGGPFRCGTFLIFDPTPRAHAAENGATSREEEEEERRVKRGGNRKADAANLLPAARRARRRGAGREQGAGCAPRLNFVCSQSWRKPAHVGRRGSRRRAAGGSRRAACGCEHACPQFTAPARTAGWRLPLRRWLVPKVVRQASRDSRALG